MGFINRSLIYKIRFFLCCGSSKDSYKLDYCYEENETTSLILTKEIKPLISTVFEGKDANVIAHGARCSGKTHLAQVLILERSLCKLLLTIKKC